MSVCHAVLVGILTAAKSLTRIWLVRYYILHVMYQ